MILRLVLGLLLAAMALGQAASFDAMPAILTAYGLTSGAASAALAVALISTEAVTAVWFLARPRSRATTPVWLYTGVAVVWAVLASQAFARGLVLDNCGCFGTYLPQPLRWYVLVEDALMLLYAGLLWRGLRRARHTSLPATARTARTPQENH
ncbi:MULTISPECIES: MauE/DoxX family redox-associated membrane protein [unclassified Streptomyces]|uniref:MauE/DoxX family redox-associated membrane protein n=1 Tax=unclassified Streptomyces TaxID=2593676 RepID=UPI000CD58EE1|nr:MauE/DoxX family redox-associated membrane protein [Streptomyces sp. SM10]